jgi:flagellar basal body rod protein FlgG
MISFSAPLQGLDRALAGLEKTSVRIAQSTGEDSVDLSAELIELLKAQRSVEANVQAIRAEDEAYQSLWGW